MSLYNDGYSNRAVVLGMALANDAAEAVFTQTGSNNVLDTDTIQVGNGTYTFLDTLGSTPGNVKIGANWLASMTNLINAINASIAGSAATTKYVPLATAADVVGELNGANEVDFHVRVAGVAGSGFPSVYSASGTSAGGFGGATFVDASPGASRAVDWTVANGLSLQFEVAAPIVVPAVFAVYGDARSLSDPCAASGDANLQAELADSDLCNSAFGPADPMIVTIPATESVTGTNSQGFQTTKQISPVGSFYIGRPRCFGNLPFVFVKAVNGDTQNVNITALLSRMKHAN